MIQPHYQYQHQSDQPMYGGPSSPPLSPQSQSQSQSSPSRYQSSSPFGYAPQSFSSYQPAPHGQYPNYPQHFSPQPEPDPPQQQQQQQGVWYYLPHAGPPTPSFQPHYPQQQQQQPYPEGHYFPQVSAPSSPIAPSPYSQNPRSPTNPASLSNSPPAPSPDPPSSHGAPPSNKHETEKPVVRRAYHPNPPAHRSEWVMWTGNVPSDADHDELWKFFTQTDGDNSSQSSGVLSIFPISRTNCAFINYDAEPSLHRAIARFNGHPLRPTDPRCPRLLCRVRRKDDDLKAGVGGQRGIGMHMKWVKENKEKGKGKESESDLDDLQSEQSSSAHSISFSSDDEGRPNLGPRGKAGSSGSFASTNSSLLSQYFPQRYFILKSLTQYDLDLSVEKGLWATQKHNEGILDQAYRTSKDVYLIFSVNKSGEFYGYAKMVGPIRQGERRVSWAQRTESSSSTRSSLSSPITGRGPIQPDTIPEESPSPTRGASAPEALRAPSSPPMTAPFFSPGAHQVQESPIPLTASEVASPPGPPLPAASSSKLVTSAPAELNQPHRKISSNTGMKHSLDYQLRSANAPLPPGFELDETAPIKAAKNVARSASTGDSPISGKTGFSLDSVREEEEGDKSPVKQVVGDAAEGDESWGESFKIEWISTKRVPFYRARHIRNPWNHDREIKVSRDGTELEPGVGQQLIEEWQQLADAADSEAAPKTTSKRGGRPPGGTAMMRGASMERS
ncbi:YT521-B-like domain-containing protein [Mycena floridula]|nr:YT521-B-like domain-containing protein [Mycena floridula]